MNMSIIASSRLRAFTDTLTISPTSASSQANNPSSQSVGVTSNASWSVTTTPPSWFTISGGSGSNNGSFTVNPATNTTFSSRSFTLTVQTQGATPASATFTISQVQNDELTINPPNKGVSNAAQNYDIAVTSNTTWTVSEGLNWAEFIGTPDGSGNGSVTVKVLSNSSSSDRSGSITFTTGSQSGSVTKTHTITQAATPPPFNPGELTAHNVSTGSTASQACNDTPSGIVYSQSSNFGSSSTLYSSSRGETKASSGFYSKDSSVLEVGNNGVVSNSGFC